ncbi:hypothetical protein TNCV_391401 [Trichonephila clavipes]|nr:hypothetical protein TNCV_391401 [Trichonephila clavipes]
MTIQTIRSRLCEVQLCAWVPATWVLLTAQHRGRNAWRGVIVIVPRPSNGIGYCSRMNLLSVCGRMRAIDVYGHIDDRLTEYRYVTQVVKPVDLPSFQGSLISIFHQDSTRPHATRGPLEQTVDDLRTVVDVAWQWLPQATINGLIDRMTLRIEACAQVRGGHIRL